MKIDGHAKDMAPCQLLSSVQLKIARSLLLGRLQATPAPVSAMLRVPASSAAPGLRAPAWAACGGSGQHFWCTGQLSPLTSAPTGFSVGAAPPCECGARGAGRSRGLHARGTWPRWAVWFSCSPGQ